MKPFLPFLFFLTIVIRVWAQAPDGYYNNAAGKSGAELKTALHLIIDQHTASSYTQLWTDMQSTDKKEDGTVWDTYSDVPGGTPPYVYTFVQDQCGTYSVEGDCYNREHSFPKSWFGGDVAPMYTDLFHIYPTDGYVNGRRSNYPFGEVDNPTWTSLNGSKLGTNVTNGYSGTVFEPIDAYKGDFARSYFYMATRYENLISNWSSDVLNGTQYPAYQDWAVELLLKWHYQDPVSQKEIDRNNAIFAIQGNRNPYIDHPEWADCVWTGVCENLMVFTSYPEAAAMENVAYNYQISVSDGGAAQIDITCPTQPSWLTFTDNGDGTALLTGTPDNTHIGSHLVVLQASDGQSVVEQQFSIEVVAYSAAFDLVNVDFSVCMPDGWTTYSEASTEDWQCSNGYLYINAYGSNEAANDWVILPPINFYDYINEVFTFDSYTKYSDTDHPRLKVFYSGDYTGGAPSTATWTELSYNYPADDSQVWTNSGEIDLSGVAGNQVYLAFQYTSSGTGGSSSSIWQVDNVVLNVEESSGENYAPEFTTTPPSKAVANHLYSYTANAIDLNGDEITFSVINQPNWLVTQQNISEFVCSGTPLAANVGTHSFEIWASDGIESTLQTVEIVVEAENPPVFDSNPETYVNLGDEYSYEITFSGGNSTVGLMLMQAPQWLVLQTEGNNFLLNGSPQDADFGTHSVVLQLNDDYNTTEQNFEIFVNRAPYFVSTPLDSIKVDSLYQYTIEVADDDADSELELTAEQIPVWLQLAANDAGYNLTGTPLAANFDDNFISLRLTDQYGAFATQEFSIKIDTTSITGISNMPAKSKLSVYPNPVLNYLNIGGLPHEFQVRSVQIISLSGQKLITKTNYAQNQGVFQLNNLENIPTGTYFVQLSDGKQIKHVLFVKK